MDTILSFLIKSAGNNLFEITTSIWGFVVIISLLLERVILTCMRNGIFNHYIWIKIGKKLIIFSLLSSYIISLCWVFQLFKANITGVSIIIIYILGYFFYKKYIFKLLYSLTAVIFILSIIIRSMI